MPWLLWNYDRQSWPERELVVVDSSSQPLQIAGRPDVRVLHAPRGTGIAAKRNQALAAARGELLTWFDDDDWQHPDHLAVLVAALASGAVFAWSRRAWFVDLEGRRCAAYIGGRRHVVFNGAGFRTAAVCNIAFPEHVPVASDTPWVAAVAAAHPAGGALLGRQDLVFWLCHASNISNPARQYSFDEPLQRLRDLIGAAAWADTDAALDALEARLSESPAA
jgi:glycosyltransferase involved in cell wall biosynthesis